MQQLMYEYNGGFFIWTKTGRRPRYRHETHESALKEATRLAKLNPGQKFIVQEFHEKVFVEVETPSATDGEVTAMMERKMQKKKLWAGVVNGQINFYPEDPQGNVQGLQGSRVFTVTGNCDLTDDTGHSIISNTAEGGGANSQDVSEQPTSQSGQQPA